MTPARRRRLDANTRRAEIVEAASAVFDGRDPHSVTFEDVADAAGVSRALVYNYFRDKGELVAAVYLRSLGRLDAALAEAVGGPLEPEVHLPLVVRTYLQFAREDPEAFRNLVDTETAHHPAVREARRERRDAVARAWGDTPEARVVASAVLGLLEAATVAWLERSDLGADSDRVANLLLAVLRNGLDSATFAGATQTTWDDSDDPYPERS
ncbi:MAG TPA: TetR/AcrR family transcriptional regulator [Acidimicrobiia bacterium]|nr:TetR/AcrR family transcriptional regulator [Acidimicrobiia bacterium]